MSLSKGCWFLVVVVVLCKVPAYLSLPPFLLSVVCVSCVLFVCVIFIQKYLPPARREYLLPPHYPLFLPWLHSLIWSIDRSIDRSITPPPPPLLLHHAKYNNISYYIVKNVQRRKHKKRSPKTSSSSSPLPLDKLEPQPRSNHDFRFVVISINYNYNLWKSMQKHLRAWGDEERRLGRLMQGQMKRWRRWSYGGGGVEIMVLVHPEFACTHPHYNRQHHPRRPTHIRHLLGHLSETRRKKRDWWWW